MSDKCPHHVRRNHACPICARISQQLTCSELAAPTRYASLNGVQLIAAERTRQVADEGWTPEHDDTHRKHEMALAASSYIAAVASPDEEGDEAGKVRPCFDWPWSKKWWKPSSDPIRNLVKAGALIAAEIDRLQRAKKPC